MTVSYSISADTTFTFCAEGTCIWAGVELTCGLIVLCMPSIPKTLTDSGVVKVYEKFRSWTRRSLSRRSSGGINGHGTSLDICTRRDSMHRNGKSFTSGLMCHSPGLSPGQVSRTSTNAILRSLTDRSTQSLRTSQFGVEMEAGNHPSARAPTPQNRANTKSLYRSKGILGAHFSSFMRLWHCPSYVDRGVC